MSSTLRDIPTWLEENKQFFKPPVCNKMFYGEGQMKAFFVGGPNQRKDYHIEEGEELFYQWKGDMVLKIVERGIHKDVVIKEGEMFLLPARIPHSPQRFADTVGLVLERERASSELDGLRYYVDGTTTSLFEKWFHCDDLGKDLPPVIKEYFASEQHRTQTPIPGTIPNPSPVTLDVETVVKKPFSLRQWLVDNQAELKQNGFKKMFAENGKENQFNIYVVRGRKNFEIGSNGETLTAETAVWQLNGKAELIISNLMEPSHPETVFLDDNSMVLVPKGSMFKVQNESDEGTTVIAFQDPTKK